MLATPLQMAMAYAALVNGGKVYSPRVAKAITSPDGTLVKAIKPVVRTHPQRQPVRPRPDQAGDVRRQH